MSETEKTDFGVLIIISLPLILFFLLFLLIEVVK